MKHFAFASAKCFSSHPESLKAVYIIFSSRRLLEVWWMAVNILSELYSKSVLKFLRPVQQHESYWDSSSALSLVGVEAREMTAYD